MFFPGRQGCWWPCLALLLAAVPVAAQQATRLAPAGEKMIAERLASYPKFDEEKAQREAAELYPVVAEGETVSIMLRGREIKGAFRGMDARFLRIGDRNVPLMDLSPEVIARFSAEDNRRQRGRYVAHERLAFDRARESVMEESREELYLKYQPLPERVLAALFAQIPAERRQELAEDFARIYDSRLPIPENQEREFMRLTAETFLAAHPELVRDGNHFWVREELEAIQRRQAEKLAAREDRHRNRVLRPQTAAPTITPDGGTYQPGVELVIACTTPDATIHYTLDGSDPDEDSPVYQEPLRMGTMANIKAIAYHAEFNDSEAVAAAPWDGGLYGSYFERMTFKGYAHTRIDPAINFNWGRESPHPSVPADLISMVWTGRLRPQHSGEYTFYLAGDDGFRFWLNDRVVVDGWQEQAAKEYQGGASLEAGRDYEVKITLVEVTGLVNLKWEWEGPETPRQIVPQEYLSPLGQYTRMMRRWNHQVAGEDGQVSYPYQLRMTNPGSFRGNYRLPVHGGENRWQQLGIGD